MLAGIRSGGCHDDYGVLQGRDSVANIDSRPSTACQCQLPILGRLMDQTLLKPILLVIVFARI